MGMLSWLRRRRLDDVDLQDEIQSHLRLDVDERIAAVRSRHGTPRGPARPRRCRARQG
jgi:hypothetical protein